MMSAISSAILLRLFVVRKSYDKNSFVWWEQSLKPCWHQKYDPCAVRLINVEDFARRSHASSATVLRIGRKSWDIRKIALRPSKDASDFKRLPYEFKSRVLKNSCEFRIKSREIDHRRTHPISKGCRLVDSKIRANFAWDLRRYMPINRAHKIQTKNA